MRAFPVLLLFSQVLPPMSRETNNLRSIFERIFVLRCVLQVLLLRLRVCSSPARAISIPTTRTSTAPAEAAAAVENTSPRARARQPRGSYRPLLQTGSSSLLGPNFNLGLVTVEAHRCTHRSKCRRHPPSSTAPAPTAVHQEAAAGLSVSAWGRV